MSDAPDDVEAALETILSHVESEKTPAQKRVAIEQKCQAIHALFGGEDPDEIYPDE